MRAQLGGVLDDAVVDDGDAAGRVDVRMGVAVARLAVGRPARVGDAGRAGEPLAAASPPSSRTLPLRLVRRAARRSCTTAMPAES